MKGTENHLGFELSGYWCISIIKKISLCLDNRVLHEFMVALEMEIVPVMKKKANKRISIAVGNDFSCSYLFGCVRGFTTRILCHLLIDQMAFIIIYNSSFDTSNSCN